MHTTFTGQVVIERLHITIRKALLSKYLEKQNNLEIEIEISLIINLYNNTKHTVTKHTPYQIFYAQDKIYGLKFITILLII